MAARCGVRPGPASWHGDVSAQPARNSARSHVCGTRRACSGYYTTRTPTPSVRFACQRGDTRGHCLTLPCTGLPTPSGACDSQAGGRGWRDEPGQRADCGHGEAGRGLTRRSRRQGGGTRETAAQVGEAGASYCALASATACVNVARAHVCTRCVRRHCGCACRTWRSGCRSHCLARKGRRAVIGCCCAYLDEPALYTIGFKSASLLRHPNAHTRAMSIWLGSANTR